MEGRTLLLRFGITSMAERASLNYINSFNSIMLLMGTERELGLNSVLLMVPSQY